MAKFNRIHIFETLAVIVCVALLVSCSTKKNKWNRRVYHNLTSHYNVWWNGDQSVKEGEKALRGSVQDDYTEILPVFNYGTKENAISLNSQMDRSIEKSAVCIQKHSMRFNGIEYVRWIDDAFLMMGKGYFYKQEYVAARRTFDYVSTQYRQNDISHTASLWLAKTYIATKQYQKAEPILQSLIVASSDEAKLPRYVRRNLDLVIGDYYVATKQYDAAVKYLKSASLTAKGRYDKTRAMFILGQIYERQNDRQRATEQFEAVIKKHPSYIMAFEARMNLAKCSSDTAAIMKMFNKMLKDSKNMDYLDRIYYSMSEVALNNNNEPLAITYLRKSVATSKTNNQQKVQSALKVATMLFDNNDYILSQAYYDTVMMTIDRNYPHYDSLLTLSESLGDLVLNLTAYQLQDSLLRLADMDSIALNNIIASLIDDYKEEQKRAAEQKEIEEQLKLLGGNEEAPDFSQPTTQSTSWYFYNTASVSRGSTEFKKKWGNRILEDFWMISNKQSMGGNAEEEKSNELSEEEVNKLLAQGISMDSIASLKMAASMKGEEEAPQLTPLSKEYYTAQIPFTDEQKAEANAIILESLNNLGFIYYDNLKNYTRGIDAYTELDTRYPENEHELSSWYYLYRMHSDIKNTTEAEFYKNKILAKYPDSPHAKIIIDPEYFVKEKQKGMEASNFYAETFEAYKNANYAVVRRNAERARELYANDTALMPRFEFLDAVAAGKLQVVDSMAFALYRLVNKYPESSIKPHALEILLAANDKYNLGLNIESARKEEDKVVEEECPYTFNPDEEYYVIVICNIKNVRINPLKVRVTDFNKNNFRMLQLNVKNIMLNKEESLITIETFENLSQAKDYSTAMFINDYIFGGINEEHYSVYLMSKSNYPIFYGLKDVEEYLRFWNKYNQ